MTGNGDAQVLLQARGLSKSFGAVRVLHDLDFEVKRGEVLTDLPVRVLVPGTRFDLEGMKWALNQSGRTDVPLIERTPEGHRLLGYSNRWNETTASR